MKQPQLKRRDFLKTATAAAVAATTATPAWADDNPPMPIVDTHTHFYDPTRAEGVPWPNPNNELLYRTVLPDEFKKLTRPHGISGTVIVEASPWVEDNQWLLDLAQDDPFILGIVGNLPIGTPEFPQLLKRFARAELFKGIRIRGAELAKPSDKNSLFAHLHSMVDAGLMIDIVNAAAYLEDVKEVCKAIPNLRIVLDHLPYPPGKNDEEEKRQSDNLQAVASHKQVFAKVSHVLWKDEKITDNEPEQYFPRLENVWKHFGNEQVIYGSNWPVSDRFGTYAEVFRVVHEFVQQRGAEAEAAYFWKNSQRAYQWEARA